jgi:hypothetical protein
MILLWKTFLLQRPQNFGKPATLEFAISLYTTVLSIAAAFRAMLL